MEFVLEERKTVLRPARTEENPFEAYVAAYIRHFLEKTGVPVDHRLE